ncbi:hypothetical protein ACN28I_13805 [Archangium gephyra]|uniref:hypothetical protein n=1 Tax=Archangium gephyra TaxID=48 RepID=UPI003B7DD8EB
MGAKDFISLDDSLWPLLVARFVGLPTLQDQEEYFAQFLVHLRREEKCVLILDTRQVRMMTGEHRQKLVEFAREHHALIRTQILGCAAVITSPVMQLAASLVLHFSPPPMPYFITRSLPEAAKWAAKCLDGAGQPHAAERIRHHYAPSMERHVG